MNNRNIILAVLIVVLFGVVLWVFVFSDADKNQEVLPGAPEASFAPSGSDPSIKEPDFDLTPMPDSGLFIVISDNVSLSPHDERERYPDLLKNYRINERTFLDPIDSLSLRTPFHQYPFVGFDSSGSSEGAEKILDSWELVGICKGVDEKYTCFFKGYDAFQINDLLADTGFIIEKITDKEVTLHYVATSQKVTKKLGILENK